MPSSFSPCHLPDPGVDPCLLHLLRGWWMLYHSTTREALRGARDEKDQQNPILTRTWRSCWWEGEAVQLLRGAVWQFLTRLNADLPYDQ